MSKLTEANKYLFGTENTEEVKKLFESSSNSSKTKSVEKEYEIKWDAKISSPEQRPHKVGGVMLIKAHNDKEAKSKFIQRVFTKGKYKNIPCSYTLTKIEITEID